MLIIYISLMVKPVEHLFMCPHISSWFEHLFMSFAHFPIGLFNIVLRVLWADISKVLQSHSSKHRTRSKSALTSRVLTLNLPSLGMEARTQLLWVSKGIPQLDHIWKYFALASALPWPGPEPYPHAISRAVWTLASDSLWISSLVLWAETKP